MAYDTYEYNTSNTYYYARTLHAELAELNQTVTAGDGQMGFAGCS